MVLKTKPQATAAASAEENHEQPPNLVFNGLGISSGSS
jgi:hypothetical protein